MLSPVTQDEPSRIYEVRAEAPGGRLHAFGARRTRADAEALMEDTIQRVTAARGQNDRYWIEEIDTTGLWQPPPLPKPRDRYTTRVTPSVTPGRWETSHVEVLDGETVIASYDRNYKMMQTFEPFRQGDRTFALISPDYTATAVLDLDSGDIVAAEEPDELGFCPAGFYVPDWWDLHDGTKLPGSMDWRRDDEWPSGDFGFVWGCVWGDDSSWKVQYLDLSAVRHGVLRREERFGYLSLATNSKLVPQDFIRCSSSHGDRQVRFYVQRSYDLLTGDLIQEKDW